MTSTFGGDDGVSRRPGEFGAAAGCGAKEGAVYVETKEGVKIGAE
jgi:hypothetical protein